MLPMNFFAANNFAELPSISLYKFFMAKIIMMWRVTRHRKFRITHFQACVAQDLARRICRSNNTGPFVGMCEENWTQ